MFVTDFMQKVFNQIICRESRNTNYKKNKLKLMSTTTMEQ